MWALAVSICVQGVRRYLKARCSYRYRPHPFFRIKEFTIFYCFMNINDDEAIGLINRLLEGLHQADLTNFGSHLQIVYVASGAQHVETQINVGAYPQPLPKGKGVDGAEASKSLPEVLATEAAMALWKKAQAAGWVDANYQPLISRTQAALLADAMAERLGIREKWKTFETLWNRKNMYRDYYQAQDQRKTLFFQDEIKKVLA
jgi:hypothetical protein